MIEGETEDASARGASRQADATRRALIEAAAAAFADHGYEAASIRAITAQAGVNLGAVTYHFGGKEGLYRAVLEAAREVIGAQPLLSQDLARALPADDVVRRFVRQTLAPLADGARARLFLRVFAWEQLRPTDVRRRLSAERPFPTVVLAEQVVRRFAPAEDREAIATATAWLLGQVGTFLRDGDYLAGPPFGLVFEGAALDRLVDRVSNLCLGGLAGLGAAPPA